MNSTPSKWKKPFFTIAVGQTISLIGSSAVQFAMIWWLSSSTHSAIVLSLAGLIAFLPQILLGPFAGVWIDRMKRKHVAIAADLFIGVTALSLALIFWVVDPPYWAVFIVLGLRSVGNVFHGPAIQAIIPQMVPSDKLVKANGWNQFMQAGAFILGPIIGAAMYGFLPMPVILLTDLIGALAASGTMAVVKIPEIKRDASGQKKTSFLHEMKEGVAVYRKDRQLCILLISVTIALIFFMPLSTLYPLMTSSYFQATALHASLIELLFAVGMMLVSLIMGLFGKIKRKLLLSYLALWGMSFACIICGLLPSSMWAFWVFAGGCLIVGAGMNLYNIPLMAYMQETIPTESQGRAFSLMNSLNSLAMPLGLMLSGPIAEQYGVPFWFLISGIAMAIIIPIALLISRIHAKSRRNAE